MTKFFKDEASKINYIASYIRAGEVPCESFDMGIELEHFIIEKATKRRVFYEGEHGVHSILMRLAENPKFETVHAEGHLIGMRCPDFEISIEPGAQFEISVHHNRSVRELNRLYHEALDDVWPILDEKGLTLLTIGLDPKNRVEDIPLIPKARYAIMNEYLHARGALARSMMRQSCALQVAVDFDSEADMVRKMRVLSALSPILYTLTDSVKYFGGEVVDHYNMRQTIWRSTDDARTGLIPGVFDDDFGYEAYARWVLGRPILFMPGPNGEAEPTGDQTLSEALDAVESEASAEQLVVHAMSIVFPDLRLKRYIEVRQMDEIPEEYAFGMAALIKGIIYDTRNLEELAEYFREASVAMVERGKSSGHDNGIQGYYYSDYFAHWGIRLAEMAERALPADERVLLTPLKAMWNNLDTPRLQFERIERVASYDQAIEAFEVQKKSTLMR